MANDAESIYIVMMSSYLPASGVFADYINFPGCLISFLHSDRAKYNKASTGWRNEMEIFSALLALCAGNSQVTGEFPSQRPVTRSFDIIFDLRPNKRLSKQSWGWWSETPSRPLWRHCNERHPAGIATATHWVWTKWPTVCSRYFQMHLKKENECILINIFLKFVAQF